MATIIERGIGQYQVKIRQAGQKPITKTFRSKKLAEGYAKAVETDIERGEYIPKAKVEAITLDAALERYTREVTCHKKGERQELVRITKMRKHPLAKMIVSQIESSDIDGYIAGRRADASVRDPAKTVSDATIRLELMLLSSFFEYARSKRWGYCRSNPAREIDRDSRLAGSVGKERRLEGGEEDKLLSALDQSCRNRDIPDVVRLALHTGMRQSEIIGKTATSTRAATLGVCWDDVTLDQEKTRGVIVLRDTKSGKGRTIPLNAAAYELVASREGQGEGQVYKATQDGLIRAVAAACKVAGMVGFTFHSLRHEATSRMVERGLSILEVQAVTGHSSGEMVRHYAHLDAMTLAGKL